MCSPSRPGCLAGKWTLEFVWRRLNWAAWLPNIREIYSIADYGRPNFIDPVFSVLQNAYWSSTHLFAGPNVAWAISFATGTIGPIDVSLGSGVFVRAVRNISA